MLLGDVAAGAGRRGRLRRPVVRRLQRHLPAARGRAPSPCPLVDFAHDLEAMAAAVTPRTRMVIVCNPNNPTGTYVPVAGIARARRSACPTTCSSSSTRPTTSSSRRGDSQDALAAAGGARERRRAAHVLEDLRAVRPARRATASCAPQLKRALDKVRQPFNVNRLAQAAALEALKHQDQVAAAARR